MLFKKKQRLMLLHDDARRSIRRSGSIKPAVETLAPLMEGPNPEENKSCSKRQSSLRLRQWVKGQLEKKAVPLLGCRRSDLRLLLGVLGASLGPFPVGKLPPTVSPKDGPLEASSAQYIVQQFVAATGSAKLQNSIYNLYVFGKVTMLVTEFETTSRILNSHIPLKTTEAGCFVLWQMMPDKWHVELAVEESKMQAGSNGKVVWRHTPWSGTHASKGPVRPLRRALQGLDPKTTANMFANALCVGEKTIGADECFILKLAADSFTLAARNDGPIEVIRHVVLGYFSQKTGLLIHMEDSHLIRIQVIGGDTVYMETTIETTIEDYKPVDGLTIAHTGRSLVRIFRFGESATNQVKIRIEEAWTIEEFAFNVPGISAENFIPPTDLQGSGNNEAKEFEKPYTGSKGTPQNFGLESLFDALDDITWKTEV